MGRALLQHLQQYVLALRVQQGAVGENIYLPLPLVGQDIGVGADGAQYFYGDALVIGVPDSDDVGMDIPQDLPAGGAHAAGRILSLALHGGGGEPGAAQQVPPAAEDHRLAQAAGPGGGAQLSGQLFLAGDCQFIRHETVPLFPVRAGVGAKSRCKIKIILSHPPRRNQYEDGKE